MVPSVFLRRTRLVRCDAECSDAIARIPAADARFLLCGFLIRHFRFLFPPTARRQGGEIRRSLGKRKTRWKAPALSVLRLGGCSLPATQPLLRQMAACPWFFALCLGRRLSPVAPLSLAGCCRRQPRQSRRNKAFVPVFLRLLEMDAHRRRASAWILVPNGRRTLRILFGLCAEENSPPQPPKVVLSNPTPPPATKATERGTRKKGQRPQARMAWIETNSSKRMTSHLL